MMGMFWGEEDDYAVKNDKPNYNTDLCLRRAMKSNDGLIKDILDYTVFKHPHRDKQHIMFKREETEYMDTYPKGNTGYNRRK